MGQVALAAIYAADAEKAVGLSGYIAAWTLLAQSRVSDVMGGPKASTYIWTAICAALGYKTLRDDLSPWPLVAVTKGKSQAEAFGISWAVGGALVTKFALTEA